METESPEGPLEVEVLFFARARELAGCAAARLHLPADSRVGAARCAVARRFPRLEAVLPSCRFALDEEFVGEGVALRNGVVLAVIPPVSGG